MTKIQTAMKFTEVRDIVEAAFWKAVCIALGRANPVVKVEVIDEVDLGAYRHFHVMVSGEHTEVSHDWMGIVVKNQIMNPRKLVLIEDAVIADLGTQRYGVVSVSTIYFHDQRRFGFSILVDQTK